MSVEPATAREVAETLLLDPEERAKLLGLAQHRYGISRDAAEDILQDTALELLRQPQCVRHPRGYLYAVFRFRCFRYIGLRHSEAELVEDVPERASAPDEIVREVILWQALASVTPGCRKLLAARYIEGKTLREAAATMALAYSGIAKTISRCLKKLRACLA